MALTPPECKDAWKPAWLPSLPPIGDIYDDWAAECARRGDPLAEEIAGDADDRRQPPASPTTAAVLDAVDAMMAERNPNTEPNGNRTEDSPGAAVAPALVLSREVKYALARFRVAIVRTDEAYSELECDLASLLDDAPAADWLLRRLQAVRRRREAMRECVTGRQRVLRFRCRCCGAVQHGRPATCNSRVCPRCVRKVRAESMARVGAILEHVEEQRAHAGRRAPHWRFVTLTTPSWSQLRPMRAAMGAAWARFMRCDLWQAVGAAVVCWEVTWSTAGWHVHAHGAVDHYLPHRALVLAWSTATITEWANAVGRGENWFAAAPAPWAAAADALRADEEHRQQFAAAARRFARWCQRHGTLPGDAIDLAPLQAVAWTRRGRGRGRRLEVVRDFRAELRALVAAAPGPAGQCVKDFAGNSRKQVVGELAKYLAKDLGGAQGTESDQWGVAGSARRLADLIAGTFRWRTVRTYGDAFDRPERQGSLECEGCTAVGTMEPDGVDWVSPERAATIERHRRQVAKERARFEARDTMPERPPLLFGVVPMPADSRRGSPCNSDRTRGPT